MGETDVNRSRAQTQGETRTQKRCEGSEGEMCGATGVGRERVLGAGSGREEASRRSKGRRSIFLCEGYIRGRRRCGCQFSSRPSQRSSQKWCDPWPVHDNCLALSSAEGTLAKAPCLVAIVLVRPFFLFFFTALHRWRGGLLERGCCPLLWVSESVKL